MTNNDPFSGVSLNMDLENRPDENIAISSTEHARSIVSDQPHRINNNDYPGTRRPIPVSTIEWTSTNLSQFTPLHGLEFLGGVEQVVIQQTVELNDLMSSIESENRYVIKIPNGETLYVGNEMSNNCQRMCLGSNRSFDMNLYDCTHQVAMVIERRLACSWCLFGCYLQKVKILTPPGDVVGHIQQNWTFLSTAFSVVDGYGVKVYQIEGPNVCSCWMYKEADFKILSPDGFTQLGSISHHWDQLLSCYSLQITFPARNMDLKHKGLLVGAAFLLEYMYFERAKNNSCCKCLC